MAQTTRDILELSSTIRERERYIRELEVTIRKLEIALLQIALIDNSEPIQTIINKVLDKT